MLFMKNLNIGKFTKKNKMSNIKIFCFGFGQVAKSFIKKVLNEERKIELSATSRKKTHKDSLGKLNFNIYKFKNDGCSFFRSIIILFCIFL